MHPVNENVKNLAEKIVTYETQEKGTLGNLFAFETRDGFWSKLAKTLGLAGSTLGGGALAFAAVAGPAGLVAAGAAAVTAGLISGAIGRAVNESIFSDLHDSNKGNLAKFGHYLATGLAGGIVGATINFFAPGAGTLAGNAIALASSVAVIPLTQALACSGIASMLGDQQLRKESAEARDLAQRAIQSGQSVEQLLGQGKQSQITQTPDEQTPEKERNFTKMIEQQRATQQQVSIV